MTKRLTKKRWGISWCAITLFGKRIGYYRTNTLKFLLKDGHVIKRCVTQFSVSERRYQYRSPFDVPFVSVDGTIIAVDIESPRWRLGIVDEIFFIPY